MRARFKAILPLLAAFACPDAFAAKKSWVRVESELGPGHYISVRGNGGGLTWKEEGARRAKEISPGVWELELKLDRPIELKPLLDNKHWIKADLNTQLKPGERKVFREPSFQVAARGTVEIRRIGNRTIRVYVPPGSRRGSGKKYHVVYFQDGDKLFAEGDRSWHADLMFDQMIAQGRMPPSVIVGVDPISPEGRMDEYTPFEGVVHRNDEQTEFGKQGGKLFDYARYIMNDVKSLIEGNYDVLTGYMNTTIGGSSLGGASALTIAVTYPETFGSVMAMSGSWLWGEVERDGNGQVVRKSGADPGKDIVYEPQFSLALYIREQLERNQAAGKPMPRIFLSVGDQEWPVLQRSMRVMEEELKKIGYQPGKDLFVYVNPMGRHAEESWAWQLRVPLTKLFKDKCRESLLPRK